MVEPIPCPVESRGKNLLPILRTPERNQYENSNKWYLNISWVALPGKSSCHRIFMEVLTMPMAKILNVLNNTSRYFTIYYLYYLHRDPKTAVVIKTYFITKI